jgi:hypothetical protein
MATVALPTHDTSAVEVSLAKAASGASTGRRVWQSRAGCRAFEIDVAVDRLVDGEIHLCFCRYQRAPATAAV